eukprot:TRINITY_DN6091_c0_g1_i1.p1 TRINITY_DN6091_c0_g1~~TRINITY_DN6091_c0_g1_i1.p1  ORF type:complete len:523 (+),score=151.80 TRINITY_DN6091_c0_g1_i1:123-1691(+)
MSNSVSDYALALSLQSEFEQELGSLLPSSLPSLHASKSSLSPPLEDEAIIGPELEDLDPTPDLHELFLKFNTRFFWSYLSSCEVKWSPRMTLCAGVCSYRRREGYCSIRLSLPLLKLRPRKDLVETLLHEMIHAYLFVTDRNDDHDGHGPEFHKHMYRINKETGTNISVYHNFHNEVRLYKQHWWKCDGPCVNRRPFYGMVKRSMNRAPGKNDTWYAEHQRSCGGNFIKIKEPEGYGQKKKKGSSKVQKTGLEKENKEIKKDPKAQDIRSLFGKSDRSKAFSGNNIVGFGGTSYSSSGTSVSASSHSFSPKKSTKGSSGFRLGSSQSKASSSSGVSQGSSSLPSQSPKKSNKTSSGYSSQSPKKRSLTNPTSEQSSPSKSSPTSPPPSSPSKMKSGFIPSSSSSGFRLGGSVLREEEQESLQQTVRNAWLNRFPPSSGSISKGPIRKKPKYSSLPLSKTSPPPSSPPYSSPNVSIEIIEDNNNGSAVAPQPSEVPCPICGESFIERGINAHLDVCLERNAGA